MSEYWCPFSCGSTEQHIGIDRDGELQMTYVPINHELIINYDRERERKRIYFHFANDKNNSSSYREKKNLMTTITICPTCINIIYNLAFGFIFEVHDNFW